MPRKKLESIIDDNSKLKKISDIENLYLKKVYVNTEKNILNIILSSKVIIDDKIFELLKEYFTTKFNYRFHINFRMNYDLEDISVGDIMDKYWDNILYLIQNQVPSSTAWGDKLDWEVNNNSLILKVSNEILLYAMKSNSVDRKIQGKINNELNKNIKVEIISKSFREQNGEIVKKSVKAEKEIAKGMVNCSNNKKVNKPRTLSNGYSYGKKIKGDTIPIKDVNNESGNVVVMGEVFDLETRDIRGNKKLFTFNITDYTYSMAVKVFLGKKDYEKFENHVKNGAFVKIEGNAVYDTYSRYTVIMLKSLDVVEKPMRKDYSEEKRVELHLHTKMSSMDGVTNFFDLAKRAKEWGHKAITITDHGVVQGFPNAMYASEELGIKVIYGLEGYLINDSKLIVSETNDDINNSYVVFDIETTGLSPKNDRITEIGAVKIEDGKIVDRYNQLVNPGVPIPEKIVELTGISDELVKNEPKVNEILPEFYEFIKDTILVAHNASFDIGFIRENFFKIGINITNPVLDTLGLTRALFPQLKSYKLDRVAKYLNVELKDHHRAVNDAEATANIFLKCLDALSDKGIKTLDDINKRLLSNKNIKNEETFHIVILAKNQTGLKNLYKLVSLSHLEHFYRKPRIPKSILDKYREGLIIGSACEAGELYKAILTNKNFNEIRSIVEFYDYLEIQPIGNNNHLIRKGLVKDEEELKRINKQIVGLGERFRKPVVATGDVHFLEPEDEIYRRILMFGQGFSDADIQPPLYFKSTDEMLAEFDYLGEKKAKEVVIYNTQKVANACDDLRPIPEGTYPPVIEGSDEKLKDITFNKAKDIYGDPLPNIVEKRLNRELNSIIENGYAVMYIIAEKLVNKSLKDGYLVGSRGSVGSSFVATMSGVTEVNPLVPHYVCPKCKYSEFIEDGSVASGIDLPDKDCPNCNNKLDKDGHDIPFEVFLGFEGDKEPDIDLNFAGEYQPVAHKYTEDLFGEGFVFRAGTIGTIASKTAYGFVRKYFDEKDGYVHPAEINRLVEGCSGVRRTSGQHPGGIMIVPEYKDIYDFSPIQYPANDKDSGVITTHFDYHSISEQILKLDILGHDVPTIIKMLEDITDKDALKISLDDEETMKLFTSIEPLGLNEKDFNCEVGTLGIPEFGTRFVRQMLVDTQPTTFAELVRISGLSHGTDVWLNNAQDLIKEGKATLSNVISTRDDIMLYLIYEGLDKKLAFQIMEKVRKGKGLSDDDEKQMKEINVPDWYLDSCNKIKYMFPKAHAAAYVMMSFRIAYYKVHYPEAFYATYFTTRANDFDAGLVLNGKKVVEEKIRQLESLGNDKTAKEKNLLTVLEVVLEMYCRGYNFENVDLYKSHSDKFLIGTNGIIPPLKTIEGVGGRAARNIVKEREKGKFISIEDFATRAKVSKTVIEALKEHNCFYGLPEANQINLFNI
ncbi:MAG TPA: PolC-type DNA polymerase III [Tissierellales bacterium]|nr:PolC-type DNA polymerase III [Tissierellales bacterium]